MRAENSLHMTLYIYLCMILVSHSLRIVGLTPEEKNRNLKSFKREKMLGLGKEAARQSELF